tara:strand:+ start:472 stop:1512 length:1041 start_codon:yes stop_codon:yes gene_type:complete
MAQKLLVVRNDKIGDFMLAWPALAYLKNASPTPHVSVLVPAYTAPLAKACPWIDEVIIDPGSTAEPSAQRALLQQVKAARFDALLTLFSTPRIAWLGWRAGIPLRVAPATKWAQIFYNLRIRQRRSRSAKPEYQYNVDLARALLNRLALAVPTLPPPPYWPIDTEYREQQRRALLANLQASGGAVAVVHPGSGGSAVNLTVNQYADLIAQIHHRIGKSQRIHWLISAGPNEQSQAQALIRQLAAAGVVANPFPASDSVEAFALQLAGADMLIAGSTGPLHIAGCLNIATAGFYPAKRSATSLRWQTCNSAEKRLYFSPPPHAGETDMMSVDIALAAQAISLFLSKY